LEEPIGHVDRRAEFFRAHMSARLDPKRILEPDHDFLMPMRGWCFLARLSCRQALDQGFDQLLLR
jgi:hypothetical protein